MATPDKVMAFIHGPFGTSDTGEEGAYANNPNDAGGETNRGITWTNWQSFFGNTHDRFMAMSDPDWQYIFIHGYWNTMMGDQIASQAVADFIADWYWGSVTYAIKHVQRVLNGMGYNLTVDGQIGPKTLAAINEVDPQVLLDALYQNREQYYNDIVAADPSQAEFLSDWEGRANRLYSKVSAYINDISNVVVDQISQNPGSTGAVVFFCLLHLLQPW